MQFGLQLIKLLIKHKYVNIKYLCGNSSVGKKISNFDKSLSNIKLPKIIKFNEKIESYRTKYNSLFLTNYRESSKNYSRKRISFDLAYNIIAQILEEKE